MRTDLIDRLNRTALAEFCRKHGVKRLASFGSVNRDDFTDASDVDILVEFEPEATPDLYTMVYMADELSQRIFAPRSFNILTPDSISRYFRDDVFNEARTLYVQA